MSLFEFTFALTSVILGLALTHIASVWHKLLLAGKRVRWAPEPILLSSIVLLVIIFVWLSFWNTRNETSMSVGWTVLQVLKLLILYIAAASCLPETTISSEEIDLYEYYDRTRRLSFGALIVSYVLFEIIGIIGYGLPKQITLSVVEEWLLYPSLYTLLIFVRSRWFNILILTFALLRFGWAVVVLRLTEI